MSIPTQRQAQAFLHPLRSKSTIFILDSRETNLLFSRFLLDCLASTDSQVRVADIDAFYSSNAVRVAPILDSALENTFLSVPPTGFNVEFWVVNFLVHTTDPAVIILDGLNTLYHLLSMNGSKRTSNRIAFLMALTSFLANSRRQTIISKAYTRNRPIQSRRGVRSLDKLGDLGISVTSQAKELTFKCVKGKGWRDDTFSVRLNL